MLHCIIQVFIAFVIVIRFYCVDCYLQDVDSVQGGPGRGQSGSTALAHSEEFRIQVRHECCI